MIEEIRKMFVSALKSMDVKELTFGVDSSGISREGVGVN